MPASRITGRPLRPAGRHARRVAARLVTVVIWSAVAAALLIIAVAGIRAGGGG